MNLSHLVDLRAANAILKRCLREALHLLTPLMLQGQFFGRCRRTVISEFLTGTSDRTGTGAAICITQPSASCTGACSKRTSVRVKLADASLVYPKPDCPFCKHWTAAPDQQAITGHTATGKGMTRHLSHSLALESAKVVIRIGFHSVVFRGCGCGFSHC